MKAKCPYCQTGCDKCKDGYTTVSMATGALYTRHCNACDEDNGGRIAAATGTPPEQWRPPGPCVWCHSPDVIWLLIGEVREYQPRSCDQCAFESDEPLLGHLHCSCGAAICSGHTAEHANCP